MHEMAGSFSSAEGAERSRMRGFRWGDTEIRVEKHMTEYFGTRELELGTGAFAADGRTLQSDYFTGLDVGQARTARECPRISPAFLEEERRVFGDRLFRQ